MSAVPAVEAACTGSEQVRAGPGPAAVVTSAETLRKLEPHYFGFSFVWVEFQESLWNDASGRVQDQAIEWMRAFPGAFYRYPGGTESNYFDWKAAAGPKEKREPRKAVKWQGPRTARFGLDEYLAFVRDVGGQPWYVANLFGGFGEEGDSKQLAEAAGQLAAYLGKRGVKPLRWELGNELDRGEYMWSADKYLAVARQVAAAIRGADPQASLVAIMEDYDAHWRWRRTSAADYNRRIASGLSDISAEYAQHSYYDGVNIEVPYSVGKRIAQICSSIEAAAAARPRVPAAIWVTEHARQPVKNAKNADWKPNWSRSANLEAALGVADITIAASQIPQIRGLAVHALHALDAPWPLLHRSRDGSQIHPSAVYWALRVLREGMEADVLRTESQSANSGGYFGGYDVRASIMANAGRTRWSAWVVNRSPHAQNLELRIPALSGKQVRANLRVLADNNVAANNYADGNRLRPRDLPEQTIAFDQAGRATLVLPPLSVMAARLDSL